MEWPNELGNEAMTQCWHTNLARSRHGLFLQRSAGIDVNGKNEGTLELRRSVASYEHTLYRFIVFSLNAVLKD